MSSLPESVKLVEVGPRDGLQNEKDIIPAGIKVALVDRLTAAGYLSCISRGSSLANSVARPDCARW